MVKKQDCERMEVNRRYWDEVVPVHAGSELYNVAGFKAGEISLDELERMQRQVVWQRRLDAAPTIPRELRAQAGYHFDPARFRGLNVPSLIIVGGRSAGMVQRQAEIVTNALRGARQVELPGQGYAAIDASPGAFVREVVEYLRDTW